jgi:hypothetical protein
MASALLVLSAIAEQPESRATYTMPYPLGQPDPSGVISEQKRD